MPALTTLERPPYVVVIAALAAGLIVVIVLVTVGGDEHEPHVDLAPPAQSLSAPPMPVASGAIVPGHLGSWRPT